MTDTNPGKDSATTSFSKDMSYADYLPLDPILGAQRPQSAAHDEMLSLSNIRRLSCGCGSVYMNCQPLVLILLIKKLNPQ